MSVRCRSVKERKWLSKCKQILRSGKISLEMDAEQLEKDISLLRYTNSPIWQWFLDNFKDEEKTGDNKNAGENLYRTC